MFDRTFSFEAVADLSGTKSGESFVLCLFSTRGAGYPTRNLYSWLVMTKGTTFMKKLALSMAAVLALLSIAGCAQYVGKGKAPPPVVTKG
jgi:hypothetical protein